MKKVIRARCAWCGEFLPAKHNEIIHEGRVVPFCNKDECQDAKHETFDLASPIIEINRPREKKSDVLAWREISQCSPGLN